MRYGLEVRVCRFISVYEYEQEHFKYVLCCIGYHYEHFESVYVSRILSIQSSIIHTYKLIVHSSPHGMEMDSKDGNLKVHNHHSTCMLHILGQSVLTP